MPLWVLQLLALLAAALVDVGSLAALRLQVGALVLALPLLASATLTAVLGVVMLLLLLQDWVLVAQVLLLLLQLGGCRWDCSRPPCQTPSCPGVAPLLAPVSLTAVLGVVRLLLLQSWVVVALMLLLLQLPGYRRYCSPPHCLSPLSCQTPNSPGVPSHPRQVAAAGLLPALALLALELLLLLLLLLLVLLGLSLLVLVPPRALGRRGLIWGPV
jgi:hypothetical protein